MRVTRRTYRSRGVVAVALALVVFGAGCRDSTDREANPAGVTSTTVTVVVTTIEGGAGTMPTTVTTATTATGAPSTSGRVRTPLAGFGQIAYRVSSAPGTPRCALLAETGEQHGRGLMNVTDLGGFDGMLFVFAATVNDQFYMKDTPLPLSIAWFDSQGRLVSTTDMEPCLNRPASGCPLYSATGPYRYALEVRQGGLGSLGIGPGTTITVGGACT